MAASPALLPLFLKLAAASLAGAVAFLAVRRHLRDEALASLRRDLRSCLLRMRDVDDGGGDPKDRPAGRRGPPAVVVIGFPAHGKSSFVNTACRALAGEEGPFLARAEAGPPGPAPAPAAAARRVFRVAAADPDGGRREGEKAGDGEEDEVIPAVDLVDSPDLPEAAKLTRADVEGALSQTRPAAECAVLVMRCAGPQRAALRKLPEIAGVIRERGLRLVVVLTHKSALRTTKQAEELRKEVASRAKTDSVYLIENYTASRKGIIHNPIAFKNSFDTHSNVLAIIRQCIEFALMHRSHLSKRAKVSSNNMTLCVREDQ